MRRDKRKMRKIKPSEVNDENYYTTIIINKKGSTHFLPIQKS
jgi:hypothetical protein